MEQEKHDAYAVWRVPNFRWYVIGRFFLTIGIQMQSVIIGWQIYDLTKDPFALGLIGLAEAVPFLSTALFAGHVADIVNRRRIILITTFVYILCACLLLFMTVHVEIVKAFGGIIPFYIVIAITGFARAFAYPAQVSYMAQTVPRELYTNSSTWNSTVWHIAAVTGPAIGGLIYGFSGVFTAYFFVIIFAIIALFFFFSMKAIALPPRTKGEGIVQSLKTGLRFVFHNEVLLGAMSLDMFAVLFGGAVAMLPVFADQVLHVGPQGLGLLRAAPAFGAVMMAMIMAYHPPVHRSGNKLLIAITGFGLCIIFFAISRNFILSLILLVMSGMFDNVSVIVRATILQLYTPDSMRGRVSSVNSIFIGSSNEVGSFESGLAARLLTLIPSVIFGGGMTLLVVALTARFAPKLRKMEIYKVAS